MSTNRAAKAILIAGPTASGKSALALDIARARGGVIINADSMQVYAEMRVLTARPTAEEEAAVPHRLFGHVSAVEPYSVARWLGEVAREIDTAESEGRLPVIVGGTGLYFKALLEGLSPVPTIPQDVRNRWREAGMSMPAANLYAELQRCDAETAAVLRPSDRQRIVRALEVIEATGRPLVRWQQIKGQPVLAQAGVAKVVVTRPRSELCERAGRRFRQMLNEAALAEAERMARMQLAPELPAMRALGLQPLIGLLSRNIGREAAIEAAERDTRHFIKRQETWLRRYMIAWTWLSSQEIEIQRRNNFPVVDMLG